MQKYNVPTSSRTSTHVDVSRQRSFLEKLAQSPVLTPAIEAEIDRMSHIKPNFADEEIDIAARISELGIGNPQCEFHNNSNVIDDIDDDEVADDRIAIKVDFDHISSNK